MDFLIAQRWPFWLGGIALGVVLLGLWTHGARQLDVSAGLNDVCAYILGPKRRWTWRLRFLIGIVVGGFLAGLDQEPIGVTWAMGQLDGWLGVSWNMEALWFLAGGLLLGLGARLSDGCTSGHSLMGIAMLNPASMVATVCFMGAGAAVVQFLSRWSALSG